MAGNVAAGILGGISGGADVLKEQAKDTRTSKLSEMAERLKMKLQDEYNIKSEGRAEGAQIRAEDRQTKAGILEAQRKEEADIRAEDRKAKRDTEDASTQQKYALEQIRAQGEETRKTLGVKQGETPDADTMANLVGQLKVSLQKAGLPVEVDMNGNLTNTDGLTKEQQDILAEAVNAYGFDVAFGNERNEDQPGLSLLWWADNTPVKDIMGIAYTGQKGILSGSQNVQQPKNDIVPVGNFGSIIQELLNMGGGSDKKTEGPEQAPKQTTGGFKTDAADVEVGSGAKWLADKLKKVRGAYQDYSKGSGKF